VLRGVVIPPIGGDTVWANTPAAYQTLPPALRGLTDQLWALHSNAYNYGATNPNATARQVHYRETVFKSTIYEAEHPVVQVHPLTGERAIIFGYFVRRLLGVSAADSAHLFAMLQDHVTRLENTVRWRWSLGDVVIWDNRATQHKAIDDYGEERRIVRRVTIDGPVSVGVDGRHGKRPKGDAWPMQRPETALYCGADDRLWPKAQFAQQHSSAYRCAPLAAPYVPQLSILNINVEPQSCGFGVANFCIWQQAP
jgi:taurine dioxygenase